MSQTIWLIGASDGTGLELARCYLESNNRVIISAKDTSQLEVLHKLEEQYKSNLHIVDMDVCQTQSVVEKTASIWNIYGGLDLCIYNAGVYQSMKVNEWNLEHFEIMNQANYMGAVRILTELIPLFEEQKKGHIAFNISISSYFGLPYSGGYSAPKAALLNFCESIRPELTLKNIKLQVINHGFVRTGLPENDDLEMSQLLEPEEAAHKIIEGLTNSNAFEIKFPWALSKFLHFLRIIPYSIAFLITKKIL